MSGKAVYQGTKIDPEKLAAWLEQHWKGEKRCPICKSNDWSISERPLELREWTSHSLQKPSFQIVAVLQCLVCGNTIFINPFVANLFMEEKERSLSQLR
jgi:hypothetical protein